MTSEQLPPGFSGLREVMPWTRDPATTAPDRQFLAVAHHFIGRLAWQRKCLGYWFGCLVPGAVGVFLYRFVPKRPGTPEYHWIVAGTLWPYQYGADHAEFRERLDRYEGYPCACIYTGVPPEEGVDVLSAADPWTALDSYCAMLSDWIGVAAAGGDLSQAYPVDVPAGTAPAQYAAVLAGRLPQLQAAVAAALQVSDAGRHRNIAAVPPETGAARHER